MTQKVSHLLMSTSQEWRKTKTPSFTSPVTHLTQFNAVQFLPSMSSKDMRSSSLMTQLMSSQPNTLASMRSVKSSPSLKMMSKSLTMMRLPKRSSKNSRRCTNHWLTGTRATLEEMLRRSASQTNWLMLHSLSLPHSMDTQLRWRRSTELRLSPTKRKLQAICLQRRH